MLEKLKFWEKTQLKQNTIVEKQVHKWSTSTRVLLLFSGLLVVPPAVFIGATKALGAVAAYSAEAHVWCERQIALASVDIAILGGGIAPEDVEQQQIALKAAYDAGIAGHKQTVLTDNAIDELVTSVQGKKPKKEYASINQYLEQGDK